MRFRRPVATTALGAVLLGVLTACGASPASSGAGAVPSVGAARHDTDATVVELPTHTPPDDGSYRSVMLDIAHPIADGLR